MQHSIFVLSTVCRIIRMTKLPGSLLNGRWTMSLKVAPSLSGRLKVFVFPLLGESKQLSTYIQRIVGINLKGVP